MSFMLNLGQNLGKFSEKIMENGENQLFPQGSILDNNYVGEDEQKNLNGDVEIDQDIKIGNFPDQIIYLENKQNEIHSLREKTTLNPNWPSFFPVIYYKPDQLSIPFNKLVTSSLRGLIALTFSCVFNLIALNHVDIQDFSYSRSFYFALIQSFAVIYFSYAFSYRLVTCSSLVRRVPFGILYAQFAVVFFCVYAFIGFHVTGFAGIFTILDIIYETNDIYSLVAVSINTFMTFLSLSLNYHTIIIATKTRESLGRRKHQQIIG
ncbi:hypothetical protein TRFO_02865 [Tritrichomonas foetus]|uniref:Uncharacterized protein n=1 Tax=Tritrichomonas foetus TaxID=1144522 RepID=A0A1J4L0Y4_9EUKA|nr:hypothetical protein TRFO_02865 [Tritrichomonas foetus]|eukprot:OHT15533.1 hypothetical protein TRFO_02865 [Tritrichomonas foetus]